jgi:hypothetical protein
MELNNQDPKMPGATAPGAPDEIEDQQSRGNAGGPPEETGKDVDPGDRYGSKKGAGPAMSEPK